VAGVAADAALIGSSSNDRIAAAVVADRRSNIVFQTSALDHTSRHPVH
jgi:hypothetical protein